MGKILGSWSGMRKYLEQDMLAPSLRGRVQYGCTTYIGMDGCRLFEIRVDGIQIKRFSWETVNSYFIGQGYTQNPNPYGIAEYWAEFQSLLRQYPASARTEYTDGEFCEALETYRSQDVFQSLEAEDALLRMFAILDRRIGKRTLARLKDAPPARPEWLQFFYQLRLQAEKII